MRKVWNFFSVIHIISSRARFVTMDETWLYQYDLETKQQLTECVIAAHPAPKIQSAKIRWKILVSIFWDPDGILLIDYLPKIQTVITEYYSSLLVQLKDILKEKGRGKVTKVVLFLHDNALAHRALATQKKLANPGFQCTDHPPFFPDLAPWVYQLFPGLKNN